MSFAATPWFDRTVARMRAWPPAAGDAAFEAARRVRSADRHGHALHLFTATLFVISCALDQAPSSIALGLLLGVASVRAFVFPEAFTPILRWPPFWFAVAWVGWAALSTTWAPSGSVSPLRSLSGQKMLCGAVMLWPIIGHARVLASAVVFAATLNSLMQIAQASGLVECTGSSPSRPSGFPQLPVVASAWSIAAIGVALTLWIDARALARTALGIASAVCAAGIALAASRGPVLAAIPAFVLLVSLLVWFGHARMRTLAVPVGLVLLSVTVAILLPGAGLLRYVAAGLESAANPAALSIELRFLWWRLALEQFAAAPVTGGGVGSFAAFVAGHPAAATFAKETGVPLGHVLQVHPHSTYLRALGELGIVGFMALVGLLVTILAIGWRGARRDAIGSAAFAGVVFMLLLAASECIETMNLTYALTVILVALCAFPRECGAARPL
jgi:O-antigen ligase